ncbi:MAG: NADH-quinone oxidoreductase subunit NuoG [Armatimonadota bacterium]
MATIYIDNVPYTVEDDERKSLLDVCLSLGFDIPFFCWHPAMHSVGACRQCAVKMFKDEHDTRGKIVMSCMTPIKDGTRISIDDPDAVAFRKNVIEWLMINHPHDCPVCDEGGECHLQDMTVMTGHVYRRYRFKKRTYRNQDLGPFVNHEMNRCIQCYRCVRFYRDFAGGNDLEVFAWHDSVYFGRARDGVLESEFSGNLVEVCPTGVFTDKTLKGHYTRKWDLQTAPSVCVHCSLGCNTIPGERYRTLRRIRNRYNSEVNGYFLCDRGRYGYEFVNSPQRIKVPLRRKGAGQVPIDAEAARAFFREHLRGKIIGIGSSRASLESNYALQALVGKEHFYHGVTAERLRLLRMILDILRGGPARTPSLMDVAHADAVLILGEDVNNTAPMLALELRQAALQAPLEIARQMRVPMYDDAAVREAIQGEHGPFFIATPGETRLDGLATVTYRAAPDDLARLGFAVAHAIDGTAPDVHHLSQDIRTLAEQIAQALLQAKRPLIVSGTGFWSEGIIQAAANVAWALCRKGVPAELCFTVPECNSLGAAMLDGGSLDDALAAAGEADTVVILENDLSRQLNSKALHHFFDGGATVIALDCLQHQTTTRANLALPAGTFAEADGTFVNNEGRAQRFFQVFPATGDIQESWRWLGEMMEAVGKEPWQNLDDIQRALAADNPALAGILDAAPLSDFRIADQKIPRQSHRTSGRTAITVDQDVHEPPPPADPDSPFAFSMEGYLGRPPGPLVQRLWSPGWNSPQAVTKFQSEVGGPLRGGNPGKRLIEPASEATPAFFTEIPPAFTPRADALLLLPAYHIFGSEALSMSSPPVARLAPTPYLAVSTGDAERLMIGDGQTVVVTVGEHVHHLPARLVPALPQGIALLPTGLPGVPDIPLPAWGRVESEVGHV